MDARSSIHLFSAAARRPPDDFPTMAQLATFSIWVLFTAVGMIGVIWRNPVVHADRPPPRPTPMIIDVSTQMPSSPVARPAPSTPQPVPPIPQPALPPAPPAVAAPSPAIAFAIPTPNVPRIVAPATAAPIAPPAVHSIRNPRPNAAGAVHRLVVGEGEGKYITLAYPEEAQIAGEEGTVEVQFTQDNDGHVTEAHLATSSRWPILNQAALRAIRQTRFPPGQAQTDVITFEFKLQ